MVVVKHELKGRPDAAPCRSREPSSTMESASGRPIVLPEFRPALAPRKGGGPSTSSIDASTLTRTDSDSTASGRSSSTAPSIGGDRTTLGWVDSVQTLRSDSSQESICQVLFAERTAMEMAQIVAYWHEYAEAASRGRAPPPPPEFCFPDNSLWDASDFDDEDDDADDEGDCGVDGESRGSNGGQRDDYLGPWLGDANVCSTESDDASRQFAQSRYAPRDSALRRRSNQAASARCPEVVRARNHLRQGRGNALHCLPHGQRWAARAAVILWISAVVVRLPESGRLWRLLAQGLLHLLILMARGYLDLLLVAQKAVT